MERRKKQSTEKLLALRGEIGSSSQFGYGVHFFYHTMQHMHTRTKRARPQHNSLQNKSDRMVNMLLDRTHQMTFRLSN